LDIQIAGAVAPGAKIAVYFGPNDRTGKGFIDALSKAVHDATNNPSVISISWGGPDEDPTENFVVQFNDVLKAAALLNITVCTASKPPPDYQANAHVPPSLNGGQTGRGVPDVSGVGDPETGFNIILNGRQEPIGGTSAVAPLWAGLIALINQKLKRRIGFINP